MSLQISNSEKTKSHLEHHMKVLFMLLGTSSQASSRVRGYWVIEELEALGIHCTPLTGFGLSSLLKSFFLIPYYDCLVLQKRYGRWDYYLLMFARLLGKKTVIDLDDKYSKTDSEITFKNLAKIMKAASAVTVGCKALLDFVLPYHPNSYLLPTSIKLANYRPTPSKGNNKGIVLGWIGNGRHYHEDLINALREPIQQVAREHDVTLKLIGVCGQQDLYDAFESISGLKTQFIDSLNWADGTEILQAMSDFDIGLYPLKDNDFNRYKCGFKALEYMAMGIPVISSLVGANADIISDGVDGFLVDNQASWAKAINTLVQDRDLRIAMGVAGRKKVEQEYDVKNHALGLAGILRSLN